MVVDRRRFQDHVNQLSPYVDTIYLLIFKPRHVCRFTASFVGGCTCSQCIGSILRAYALGYVSITGPRLLGLLGFIRRKDVSIKEKLRRVSFKVTIRT